MKLLTLKLENFQGIKAADYKFNGKNANIYGDNATGKTTIFNAYTWLLFDKPSTGAKGFTPKTKGSDGDIHNLGHAAEAQFRTDDGRIVTLRKVFSEVYKKKRGSSTKEFDGHTTEFFIDSVPVKEKEYQSTIDSVFGTPELLKMLTMPMFFAEEMDWQSRRQILLEICGDVTDEDVIRCTAELKDLPSYLLMPGTTDQFYTVDEYKKIAAATKSTINKQLQDIPGRIDEAQRAIPDLKGIDEKAITKKIADLTKTKSKVEADKAAALSGDTAAAALRSKIADLQAELAEANAAHAKAENAKNEANNAKAAEIRQQISDAKSAAKITAYDLQDAQRHLDRMKTSRQALLAEYVSIQERSWDESAATCPACRRPLPDEDVQKLREDYNRKKSDTLMDLNARGQQECSKDMISALEEEITALEALRTKQDAKIAELEKQLVEAGAEILPPVPFEQTAEHARISAAIESCRAEESNKAGAMKSVTQQYDDKIRALSEEIRAQEEQKTRIALADQQQKRIAELATQEKNIAKEYEYLEYGIYLCESFVKAKVNLLTDRINEAFRRVNFRLFIDQINGGVKEDCEVLVPGEGGRMVPYRDANNAARINAGLEVIKVLSDHWGVSMPVFIDNAESVTHLSDMGGQIIRLVVSENDKKLRLEIL